MNSNKTLFFIFFIFLSTFTKAQSSPFLYVCEVVNNNIRIIDLSSNLFLPEIIQTGNSPFEFAADPSGTFGYVPNSSSNNITIIDLKTNQALPQTIPTGNSPEGIAITPDGQFMYVSNFADDNIYKIQLSDYSNIKTIDMDLGSYGMEITPDGRYCYITIAGGNMVQILDLDTDTFTGITIPTGSAPDGIAINPDGTYAFVANRASDNITIIDLQTNQALSQTIPTGDAPEDMVITPDGQFLYVSNFADDNIYKIQLSDYSLVETLEGVTSPAGMYILQNLPFQLDSDIIISGECKKNTFLTQTEYFNSLSWYVTNFDTITENSVYRIYRESELIGIVSQNEKCIFKDRNISIKTNKIFQYTIVLENELGEEIAIGSFEIKS